MEDATVTAADTGAGADAAPDMPVAGETLGEPTTESPSADLVAAHGQAVAEPDSRADFLRGLPDGWTEETTDAG